MRRPGLKRLRPADRRRGAFSCGFLGRGAKGLFREKTLKQAQRMQLAANVACPEAGDVNRINSSDAVRQVSAGISMTAEVVPRDNGPPGEFHGLHPVNRWNPARTLWRLLRISRPGVRLPTGAPLYNK